MLKDFGYKEESSDHKKGMSEEPQEELHLEMETCHLTSVTQRLERSWLLCTLSLYIQCLSSSILSLPLVHGLLAVAIQSPSDHKFLCETIYLLTQLVC